MNKKVSRAFNKDIYFLGIDKKTGEYLWMEEPKWDCGWYWGFGYVENYTNNKNPEKARGIRCHQHFNGLIWWTTNEGKYLYHIKEILDTPLSEDESWELSDLMKRFYSFRDVAEIFHSGNGHMTSNTGVDSTNKELEKYINEVELPKIFKRVIEILTP